MKLILLFGSFCLIAAVAAPDSAPALIQRPALGFAYDRSQGAVRPIQGIPGAAVIGEKLALGFAVQAAVISPGQDFALAAVEDRRDPRLRLVLLHGGRPVSVPLDGAISSPNRMMLSPSGQAAVLGDASSRLQLITGLPGSPSISDLPPQFGFPLAVSDHGMTLFAGADSAPVWLPAQGGALPSSLPGSITVAAFQPSGTAAVAITRAGDVFLVRDPAGSAEVREIRAGDERTAGPVAAGISADGAHAFSINSSGTASTIDLQAGTLAAVSCQCSPTGLQPLNSEPLFRINEISSRPLLLFDGSGSEPRIWFVPAAGEARRTIQ